MQTTSIHSGRGSTRMSSSRSIMAGFFILIWFIGAPGSGSQVPDGRNDPNGCEDYGEIPLYDEGSLDGCAALWKIAIHTRDGKWRKAS
jgi:hypothetical protein